MAITRILELNRRPLADPQFADQRYKPSVLCYGRNTAVGDVSGGAITFKFRVTNARTELGNLFYIIEYWRFVANDSNAANQTLKVPYLNWDLFQPIGADVELFFDAGLDTGAQILAPDPNLLVTPRRYIGKLVDGTDTLEVQLITSTNTNSTAYLAIMRILGFLEDPILLGLDVQ